MTAIDNEALIRLAKTLAQRRDSGNGCESGEVACVLQTSSGKLFKGISLSCACGIGFCAEHAAIAAMLLEGETEIARIVAVNHQGKIYPPCGRCRELLYQVNKHHLTHTHIIIDTHTHTSLQELLPLPWQTYK